MRKLIRLALVIMLLSAFAADLFADKTNKIIGFKVTSKSRSTVSGGTLLEGATVTIGDQNVPISGLTLSSSGSIVVAGSFSSFPFPYPDHTIKLVKGTLGPPSVSI